MTTWATSATSASAHGCLLNPAKGIGLGQSVRRLEHALGPLDEFASLQPLGQLGDLRLKLGDLRIAGDRHLDRRHEVAFAERLDEQAIAPASRARSTSSRWENAVRMTTGAIRAVAIFSAAEMPSNPGIFTSRMTRSGRCCSARSTAAFPSPASATTSKPSSSSISFRSSRDERLVLADHDATPVSVVGSHAASPNVLRRTGYEPIGDTGCRRETLGLGGIAPR